MEIVQEKRADEREAAQAETYSGITAKSATSGKKAKGKRVRAWTRMINNNANSAPLFNDPAEGDS